MSERKSQILRELKNHGKRMKDLSSPARKVLKESMDEVQEAVRVAVRYNEILAKADDLRVNINFQYYVTSDHERVKAWAKSEESIECIIGHLHENIEKQKRVSFVERRMLSEFRCYIGTTRFSWYFSFFQDELKYVERLFPEKHFKRLIIFVESGEVSVEDVEESCDVLINTVKKEKFVRRARELQLNEALHYRGMAFNKGSYLYKCFLEGTTSRTADEIAEFLAKSRYLESGACEEFNQIMSSYVVDGELESGQTRVSLQEYYNIRKVLVESWKEFPIVWPWLIPRIEKIQRRLRAVFADPYSTPGRNRLRREFEAMCKD